MSNQLAIKTPCFRSILGGCIRGHLQIEKKIDYIMIEERWSSSIQNVTTNRDADCDTDHELLVATLKIRLKCKKKKNQTCQYAIMYKTIVKISKFQ